MAKIRFDKNSIGKICPPNIGIAEIGMAEILTSKRLTLKLSTRKGLSHDALDNK
jgi:hypothetical protein